MIPFGSFKLVFMVQANDIMKTNLADIVWRIVGRRI